MPALLDNDTVDGKTATAGARSPETDRVVAQNCGFGRDFTPCQYLLFGQTVLSRGAR